MSIFTISSKQEATQDQARGLYIAGADGTPRWIWPVTSNTPSFLQFIQAITWRQRAFVAIVRLIFFLRLQRIVFPSVPLGPDEQMEGASWAIFTGTPGPNRKQVVVNGEHTVTKKATTEGAAANLANEAFFLRHLQAVGGRFSFAAPQPLGQTYWELTMQKLPNHGTWSQLTNRHVSALLELRESDPTQARVGDWREWGHIHTRIERLKNTPHANIPTGLVANLQQLVAEEDLETTIGYGLAHGDFTPWNTLRLAADRLGIIDWELAREAMPAGFDFFHFHLQQGIMVERKSWREIYAGIREQLSPVVREKLFGTAAVSVDRYLRLYLIHHLSYYLTLYQRQAEWHQQIYWQLDVWSDAVAALLPRQDQRKQLIARLFDVLGSHGYAVLKMTHDDPIDLPAESDLDLLIGSKEEARSVIARLKTFPGLADCRIVHKSFMASLFLVLHDGQILNVDLIWQLKRKATVFMDAGGMIRNAVRNGHNIPVVSTDDTRRYVRFFYGLNGAAVPAKFGQVEAIPARHPATLPANTGLRGLGNRLNYLRDSLRTMLFHRGFVLTFSGVDGAGKSTVIEHVVTMLDKQFRRPVKVLRHRPSVLPILSAYRYGKAEAERKSVASLPRTGNNTHLLSSLARFGYYYLDYLLGQWYVQLRYVLRGYVVVYDRYYYDFMIDGRRSNLELPAGVTAAGFGLVRKPAFNFFLFADPDVILARKQELQRETIVALTQRYHALFEGYQQRYPKRVFTNIENVVLEDTLAVIRKAMLQHKR